MFEAYSVGVTLRLHNFVSASLLQIGQEFKQVHGYSDALRASLKATTAEVKGLAAALKSIHTPAPGGRPAAAAAANETTAAFVRATEAVQKYKTTVQAATQVAPQMGMLPATSPLYAQTLAAHQAAIAAVSSSNLAAPLLLAQRTAAIERALSPPVILPPALPAVTAGRPYGALAQQSAMAVAGSGRGAFIPPILPAPRLAAPAGMPYTPYRVHTPAGGGAGGAGGGGSSPGAVPPGAGGGGSGFGVAPMGALIPMAGVAGTIYGAKALYQASRDYELAFTRFRGLNFGEEANKQANDFARKSRVSGVSSTQLMDTLSESVGLFGSMPNALKLAPKIAQLNAANSALFAGKIGAIDPGVARSIGRFNDMRGLTNGPEDFERGLNLAQKLVVSSGGATKFSDLEQLAKRGGAAFKGMSDEGIIMLSSYLQEQGGNSAGTSLMSFYQNLVAGRTTKGAMAALEAAGLVKTKLVKSGAVGGKKSSTLVIDDIKDEKLLRENAPLWMMTYLPAAAKAAGKKTDSEVIKFVNDLVSNRRGSDIAGNYSTQQEQALRDATNTKRAWGTDQTIAEYGKTAAGKQADFIAAWSNFKTEFGTAALPAFTSMLTSGSSLLRSISTAMASPGFKSFITTYQDGFKLQGSVISKAVDTLFAQKPGAQEVRTGAAVPGNETAGGTFTGYRSPIRTAAAGAGRGTINNTIVMPDGRVLARVVTQEQGKEMNRPQTGARTADGRQSLRAFDLATGG